MWALTSWHFTWGPLYQLHYRRYLSPPSTSQATEVMDIVNTNNPGIQMALEWITTGSGCGDQCVLRLHVRDCWCPGSVMKVRVQNIGNECSCFIQICLHSKYHMFWDWVRHFDATFWLWESLCDLSEICWCPGSVMKVRVHNIVNECSCFKQIC